jgi:hypothetical protein
MMRKESNGRQEQLSITLYLVEGESKSRTRSLSACLVVAQRSFSSPFLKGPEMLYMERNPGEFSPDWSHFVACEECSTGPFGRHYWTTQCLTPTSIHYTAKVLRKGNVILFFLPRRAQELNFPKFQVQAGLLVREPINANSPIHTQ